jgi:uncharacterized protein (TIGR02996 family)
MTGGPDVTTTRDELLRRILLEPDDDAPRLVLADWLEEYGDDDDRARAAFIRVQVELTSPCRLGYSDAYHVDDVCVACDPLARREQELLHDHASGWANELLPDRRVSTDDPEGMRVRVHARKEADVLRFHALFRRGFVEVIELDAAGSLAHADALLAAAPLREVRLTSWPGVVERGDGRTGLIRAGESGPLSWHTPDSLPDVPLQPGLDRWGRFAVLLCAALWPGIRFHFPAP